MNDHCNGIKHYAPLTGHAVSIGSNGCLTLFYMGGGSKRSPPTDYRTAILLECPEWADFS